MALQRNEALKVQIFAHCGVIGIDCGVTIDDKNNVTELPVAIINEPNEPGQLGFLCDASKVQITKEALEILKTEVSISSDDISELNLSKLSDGTNAFGWMGGLRQGFLKEDASYNSKVVLEVLDSLEILPDDFEIDAKFKEVAEGARKAYDSEKSIQ